MRYYFIIDTTTGNVDGKFNWADDRDLPTNYPLGPNQQIVTLLDAVGETQDVNSCYNPNTKTFGPKLIVTSDATQISHVNGTANITITYPVNTVNESANFIVDGQTVTVSIVSGTATIPFSNQVVGYHNISIASTSLYGKANIVIQVV